MPSEALNHESLQRKTHWGGGEGPWEKRMSRRSADSSGLLGGLPGGWTSHPGSAPSETCRGPCLPAPGLWSSVAAVKGGQGGDLDVTIFGGTVPPRSSIKS